MNTIKFRGKRVDNDEWVYGCFDKCRYKDKIRYYIVGVEVEQDNEVIPETVSRFTGYTDNNGREIYEGDIICLEKRTNACAVVRYGDFLDDCEDNDKEFNRQLGFYVEHLYYKNDYRRFLYWVDDCEVVGNIFEREVRR